MIIERTKNLFKGIRDEDYGKVGMHVSASGNIVVINARFNCVTHDISTLSGRSDVCAFSARSAARMRRYLRTSMAEYKVMVTLTYPHANGFNGASAKRDLKVFLQRMRRYAGATREYSTFWFMEFQSRGSIHFHLFSTNRFPKDWIARSWYEVVGSEDSRHFYAGTRIEAIKSGKHGIAAYAAKYAAKQVQKVIPDDFGWSGRFWGVSGRRSTLSADILLDARCLQSSAISRKVKVLEDALETAIFKGQAEMKLIKDSDNVVIYLKERYLVTYVRILTENIRATYSTSLFCRSSYWPELDIDICE